MQGLAGVPPCLKGQRWPSLCLFPLLCLAGTLHVLFLLVVSLLHCCSLCHSLFSFARYLLQIHQCCHFVCIDDEEETSEPFDALSLLPDEAWVACCQVYTRSIDLSSKICYIYLHAQVIIEKIT